MRGTFFGEFRQGRVLLSGRYIDNPRCGFARGLTCAARFPKEACTSNFARKSEEGEAWLTPLLRSRRPARGVGVIHSGSLRRCVVVGAGGAAASYQNSVRFAIGVVGTGDPSVYAHAV